MKGRTWNRDGNKCKQFYNNRKRGHERRDTDRECEASTAHKQYEKLKMLKVHFCAYLSTFSLAHTRLDAEIVTNSHSHSFFNSYMNMLRKHVVKVPLLAKCIRREAFKFNDMFIDCCVYKK
jgi:hypothetical protein